MKIEFIIFPDELLENKKQYNNCPAWLKYYFKVWNIAPSEHGCVAKIDDELIGLVRFSLRKNNLLKSKVTLIKKQFRNKNVASLMWDEIVNKFNPKEIIIFTATKSGDRFAQKLKEKYTKIDWKISSCR